MLTPIEGVFFNSPKRKRWQLLQWRQWSRKGRASLNPGKQVLWGHLPVYVESPKTKTARSLLQIEVNSEWRLTLILFVPFLIFLEPWYVSIRPLVNEYQHGRHRIALREQGRDDQRVACLLDVDLGSKLQLLVSMSLFWFLLFYK